MEQQEIRDYNNQQYSVEEGAALIKELNDRTRSNEAGFNSIGELAEKVKGLVPSGGGFSSVVRLNQPYINEHQMNGALHYTFSQTLAPKMGAKRIDYLVADGINIPTFSNAFVVRYNGFVNEQNRRHRVFFEYMGGGKVLVDVIYI